MSRRRKSREHALKILYQRDFTKENIGDILKDYWKENNISPAVKDFSEQLAEGTVNNLKEIDSCIKKSSEHWMPDRMSAIDRNILRMAAHELIFMEDIPPKVTIDEAIEIAKKFGANESADFVNGILDKIKSELEQADQKKGPKKKAVV